MAAYPDDPRVRYQVKIPEELYNNTALDLVTIMVMLSAFHGMNIPTLLNELSTNFESNKVHEPYKDKIKESKQGDWNDKE